MEALALCTVETYELKYGPAKARRPSRYVRTGVEAVASGTLGPMDAMVDFSATACPACAEVGGLSHHLGEMTCPQCRAGSLREDLDVE